MASSLSPRTLPKGAGADSPPAQSRQDQRRLRVLELESGAAPDAETPVAYAGEDVGRITSAVPGLALAYVRVEVPDDAELDVAGIPARLHLPS